jgi:hypothetical protein
LTVRVIIDLIVLIACVAALFTLTLARMSR